MSDEESSWRRKCRNSPLEEEEEQEEEQEEEVDGDPGEDSPGEWRGDALFASLTHRAVSLLRSNV